MTTIATYLIEKPSFDDLDEVMSLWRGQYEYHHQLDPTYYVSVTDILINTMREYVKTAIEKDSPYILVARDDRKTIGFVTYKVEENTYFDSNIKKFGQIIEVFVDSFYRGNGVGALLMQTAERFFKEKKISHVMVQSSAMNPQAADFYHAKGYTTRQHQHFKLISSSPSKES